MEILSSLAIKPIVGKIEQKKIKGWKEKEERKKEREREGNALVKFRKISP